MSLGSLIHTINSLMGFLSAFLCGLVILFIAFMYMAACAQSAVVTINDVFSNDYDGARIAGRAFGQLLFLAPLVHLGVAFSRFLLRVAPPRLSGRVRLGTPLVSIPLALICVLFIGTFLLRLAVSGGSAQSLWRLAILPVLLLTWCGAFTISIIKRQFRPTLFLNQPFVLFLRRFSGFSDRAVINLILKQTPPTKPIVFLVPSRSRPGDWNPFLVGFAGMKFFHPFRNLPVVVKSRDDNWKQAIEPLINRAQIIILDISQPSGAIETELEMIDQAACWPKTIFLKDIKSKANHELERKIQSTGGQIIYYKKRWIRGIPRMIMGYWVLSLGLAPIFALAMLPESPLVRGLTILFVGLLWVWLLIAFFIRPSIDRAAKISLKEVLLLGKKNLVS
jgi:hypothetical protein